MASRKSKKNQQSTRIRKIMVWMWIVFFGVVGLFALFMATISWGWWGYMPDIKTLENPKMILATEIYSADEVVIGKIYRHEDRTKITFKDIPEPMQHALIATEDIRFKKHSGIDLRSLSRAVFFIGSKGGASTITQQLAKNMFHNRETATLKEKILQKFKEWVISARLENRYTKEEIMTMYFNEVLWGQSAGIKSAANTFFNKEVNELNTQEAAMLVGMLKAPTRYNPKRNPEEALLRRNTVLNQMRRYDFIDKQACDSLKNLPIELDYNYSSHNKGMATYLREQIRLFMHGWCEKRGLDVYNDGLKIFTTIDSRIQKYAEAAVANHMAVLQDQFVKETKRVNSGPWRLEDAAHVTDKSYIPKQMKRTYRYISMKRNGKTAKEIEAAFRTPKKMTIFSWTHPNNEVDTVLSPLDSLKYYKQLFHTGFMAMDPHTGHIKAWVGGIDFEYFKYDHVNVRSTRQVGSTFKPIVYARALEDNVIHPCEWVSTAPVTFELEDGNTWTPRNSAPPDEEELHIYQGLQKSMNTITALVMKRMEPGSPYKVKDFSDKLGIATDKFQPYPSICLGTMDISVQEMVGAYAAFVNEGQWVQPIYITRIEDKHGNVLEDFAPKTAEAMSKQTAYVMLEMLDRVTRGGGTAVRLRYKYGITQPMGGKTGTTQNNSDGWFMGLTPDLVAGCWVGCEDRQVRFLSTSLGQGANMALPVYADFIKNVYADRTIKINKGDFPKPESPFKINLNCEAYPKRNGTTEHNDEFIFR